MSDHNFHQGKSMIIIGHLLNVTHELSNGFYMYHLYLNSLNYFCTGVPTQKTYFEEKK